jgi:hypothetical protein
VTPAAGRDDPRLAALARDLLEGQQMAPRSTSSAGRSFGPSFGALGAVAALLAALVTHPGCRRNPSKLDPADGGKGSDDTSRDPAALAGRFDRQCVAGNMESCRNLGVMYAEGKGVTADRRRAAALWGQACDGGNQSGCNALALALAEGLGVDRDPARAVATYQKACDGGYTMACRNLGMMLRDGAGVPADLPRAQALLDKACQGGVPFACTNLGDLVARQTTSAKDPRWFKAIDHYKAGCDAGDPTGCRQIGLAYLSGNTSLPKSANAAAVWLDRACVPDDPVACRVLGVMRIQGVGVRQDVERGKQSLGRACAAHDDEACRLLKEGVVDAGSGSGAGSAGSGTGSAGSAHP